MNTARKQPDPIDVHVGARVRLRRMMLGMSQEKLGEALGVTFQQVQKYEKGTNRFSASRLQHAARVLRVPVAHFFEDAPGSEPGAADVVHDANRYVVEFLSTSEGIRLNRAFARIADRGVRAKFVELMQSVAGGDVAFLEAAE